MLTQRDEWFMGKFSPEKLEQLINERAAEGWRVVGIATADVGAWFGAFGSGSRREVIIMLEKTEG